MVAAAGSVAWGASRAWNRPGPKARHGVARHSTAWRSTARHSMAQHWTGQYGTAWRGTGRLGTAHPGAGTRRRCLRHGGRQAGTRGAASCRATGVTSPRPGPADAGDKVGGSPAAGRGPAEPHSPPSPGVRALHPHPDLPPPPHCPQPGQRPGPPPCPGAAAGPGPRRRGCAHPSPPSMEQSASAGVAPLVWCPLGGGQHGCHPAGRRPCRRVRACAGRELRPGGRSWRGVHGAACMGGPGVGGCTVGCGCARRDVHARERARAPGTPPPCFSSQGK